jgi:hypothetical protein
MYNNFIITQFCYQGIFIKTELYLEGSKVFKNL